MTPRSASRPAFGRLWLARDVAALGNWVVFVAFLIFVFSNWESSSGLSVLLAAQLLPPLLLWPLLRQVIGELNATAFAIAAQAIRASIFLSLLLMWPGEGVALVLKIAFFASLPVPFFQVSQSVLLRSVVAPSQMANARRSLFNSSLATVVVGPSLGAIVYGAAGMQGASIVAAIAMLASAVLLFSVRPTEANSSFNPGTTDISAPSALPVALTTALGDSRLQVVAIVQILTALLTGGLVVAMGSYTVNGLIISIDNIAILLAAQGAGTAIGGIAYGRLARHYSSGVMIASGLAIIAGGELGFAVSSSLPAGIALMTTIGLGIGFLATGLADISEKLLAGEAQLARDKAGVRMAVQVAVLLSAIAVGPLCDTISARFTLVISGILLTVLALYAFGAVPEASAKNEVPDREGEAISPIRDPSSH